MANTWCLKAFELNELLSKYRCFPYIMLWDNKNCPLGYLEKNTSQHRYFLFSITISASGIVLFLLSAAWRVKYSVGNFPWLAFGIWVFIGLCATLAFGVDVVLSTEAEDYVECINKLDKFGAHIASLERPFIKRRQKILSIYDTIGLFAMVMVAFVHLATMLFPLCIVLAQTDMDPIYSLLSHYFQSYNAILSSTVFLIIRLLLFNLILSQIFRTITVLGLTILVEAPLFYQCLNHFRRYPVNHMVLALYARLYQIRCINSTACGTMMQLAMSVFLLINVFSRCCCLFVMQHFNPLLRVGFVGQLVLQDLMLVIMMPLAANVCDVSTNLIRNWKLSLESVRKQERTYVRKSLSHFRPIAFRCGNIGKIRRDTKREYFNALLYNFIDATLMLKTFH